VPIGLGTRGLLTGRIDMTDHLLDPSCTEFWRFGGRRVLMERLGSHTAAILQQVSVEIEIGCVSWKAKLVFCKDCEQAACV